MRYWDASALVPLLVDETGTRLAQTWLREDPRVTTWALTTLEIASGIERRAREGSIDSAQRQAALDRTIRLARSWDEVVDLAAVRERALTLVARYPLKAADAAQLGAALHASAEAGSSLPFVCLDGRLAAAAAREGLPVLTWP